MWTFFIAFAPPVRFPKKKVKISLYASKPLRTNESFYDRIVNALRKLWYLYYYIHIHALLLVIVYQVITFIIKMILTSRSLDCLGLLCYITIYIFQSIFSPCLGSKKYSLNFLTSLAENLTQNRKHSIILSLIILIE